MTGASPGVVVAVNLSAAHCFSKLVQKSIRLLAGWAVSMFGVPIIKQRDASDGTSETQVCPSQGRAEDSAQADESEPHRPRRIARVLST